MALINGDVSNLSQFLTPDGNPDTVAIDRSWGTWVHDHVEKTNNFSKCGIVGATPQLDQTLLQSGVGRRVMIPHTTPINIDLKPQRLTNHDDIHTNPSFNAYSASDVKIMQAQSFGASSVDDYLTGADTFDNISQQFVDYEAHQDEMLLIKVINEAFLNDDIRNAKELDKSGSYFNAMDFAKATSKMGDTNMDGLTKLAVNSATYNYMVAQDLIKYVQPSGALHKISLYNGYQITVDDDIPLDPQGNTVMYIFGNGAVTFSAVTMPNGVVTTVDPIANGGIRAITHKRVIVSHVNGTMADLDAAEKAGYVDAKGDPEPEWDRAVYAGNVALYKPQNPVSLKDMNLVKYTFKIDKGFCTPGVNVNTDHVGGASTSNSSGSNSSSSRSSSKSSK